MKGTLDDSKSDSFNDDLIDEEVANICLMAHLSEVDSCHNNCDESQK